MGVRQNLLSSEQAQSVVFTSSLRGFDFADVDQLVDGIAETLARLEDGGILRSQHLTIRQIEETELEVVMGGYDIDEVNDLLRWAIWTLRKYEEGYEPDRTRGRTPRSKAEEKTERVDRQHESKTPPTSDVYNIPSSHPGEQQQEPGEAARPMTSEELIEQAKKWLNR